VYAAEHNLKNGQKITMDAALKDLLNPPEGTEITYLNIQRYMKDHYIKDTPVVPPVQSQVEEPPKSGRPAVKTGKKVA